METIILFLEEILEYIARYAILMFEFIGVIILVKTAFLGIHNYFVKRNPETRLLLAEGMATGLEFKLGGEILRTVIVREMSEILLVGGIVVLRIALTLLIHWEIQNERRDQE